MVSITNENRSCCVKINNDDDDDDEPKNSLFFVRSRFYHLWENVL